MRSESNDERERRVDPLDRSREELGELLRDLATWRMPFGRYGPTPGGRPGWALHHLPLEYLEWFARRGWPGGRLGELMRGVWEIKSVGAEEIFSGLERGVR